MDTKGKGFWECGVQRPQCHSDVRHVPTVPQELQNPKPTAFLSLFLCRAHWGFTSPLLQ